MYDHSHPDSSLDRTLSTVDKKNLYEDGYIIIRNAIPPAVVDAALNRLANPVKGEYAGADRALTDLVNASSITSTLRDVMGNFDPPRVCQLGINPIRKPGEYFNNLGYKDCDMPYFGAETHIDGSLTIRVPQEVQDGTPEDIYNRYIASGPKGDLGRCADVIGHNQGPLFDDPEMTLGLGSFTAFVFVCLNDQTKEGCGQTALLRGSHHAMQSFFRWQRDTNNHIGIEGAGWNRLNYEAPNRCGLVYIPNQVRDQFIDETSESTPDGQQWARPTQILMEKGDACITMYHISHSATRNELGTEPRKSIIFRIRNKKRQPNVVVNGVTDHPDRGPRGAWLEFEEGNDPWERSKYAMCNMWDEWEGMQDIVAEMESAGA